MSTREKSLSASQNYVWNENSVLGQGATSKVYKGRNKVKFSFLLQNKKEMSNWTYNLFCLLLILAYPAWDGGGLSREYVLRISSVS